MKLHEDKFAFLNIINLIHEDSSIRADILEKDYYVTLLLRELAGKQVTLPAYFKGGTALYKAQKSIRRFSEDIDLTVCIDNCSNSQAKKRLEMATKKYQALPRTSRKDLEDDRKGSITTVYDYTPLVGMHMVMQNELGNAEPYFAATSPVLDLTVIRPDDAPHILPCFDEADEGISISEDEPLSFRYNPKQVIKLMGKRYLVGPVIFHRFDDDGNFASLTMSDMYAIQKYLESSSVTLMIDRDKLTCICID